MKKIYLLLLVPMLCFFFADSIFAEDIAQATKKKAAEVQALKLGFGNYILGQELNDEQKKFAAQHPLPVAESKNWTYKFQDGNIFVVADKKTNLILGIYKEQEKASRLDVKIMVGDLMMNFAEPTLMAHDQMIYWAYDKKGKISQKLFMIARETGDLETLATVKFSSTEPIFREVKKSDKVGETIKAEEKTADIYVIITSGPLSSFFIAQNK
ncbi:MAG: hypothetical protein PF690_12100 [Deltaproteobacteria bacterium]|jgi:hypothetical protein|nr:hypothetical protein [Deltaproteobacteria bacterium]